MRGKFILNVNFFKKWRYLFEDGEISIYNLFQKYKYVYKNIGELF